MIHLGRDLTALVDGQLPPERTERALVHLVHCQQCAAEVAAERASRRTLADAPLVEPSPDLTDRLLSVPAHPAASPPHGPRAWAQRAAEPLADRRVRRRLISSSSVTLAGAATVVGALVVVGAMSERPRDPALMLDQVSAGPQPLATQRLALSPDATAEATAGTVPEDVTSTDSVLAWMAENGWSAPEQVPAVVHVADVDLIVNDGAPVLELELVGGGHRVQIIEQQGQLSPETLAELDSVDLDDEATAHVLPGHNVRLLVQCADNAVMVVANTDLAFDVAAALPAAPYDTGMLGRIDRGWGTVVGWTAEVTGAAG